jgi:hypothetical protein
LVVCGGGDADLLAEVVVVVVVGLKKKELAR